jgi:SAM-dependent methyltransferase
MTNFEELYANCYDLIHVNKDYAREALKLQDFIESKFLNVGDCNVLDFGCGTGEHLNALAKTNLVLHGYDMNENMISLARRKFQNLQFQSDLAELSCEYNLIYSLFDVVSYQDTDEKLANFFSEIGSKLVQGGYFICDGWNLPGVRLDPPAISERSFLMDNSEVLRRVEPSTKNNYRVTRLAISLMNLNKSEVMTAEQHYLRAFEIEELVKIAQAQGFSEIRFQDPVNWSKELEPSSWRFVMFARKV